MNNVPQLTQQEEDNLPFLVTQAQAEISSQIALRIRDITVSLGLAAIALAAAALVAASQSSFGGLWAVPAMGLASGAVCFTVAVLTYPGTNIGPDIEVVAREAGSGPSGLLLQRLLADLNGAIQDNDNDDPFRAWYNIGLAVTVISMVMAGVLFGIQRA